MSQLCWYGGFGGFTSCGFGGGFGGGFGFGGFGAFGYVQQDNLRAKATGSVLGTSAISALVTPPSIIALRIGARPQLRKYTSAQVAFRDYSTQSR